MKQPKVMVFLMTGFLDSGKTDFLNFTLRQEYFQTKGKTLVILCEEGESEYDEEDLKQYRTVVERVEDQEDFTEEYLKEMDKKHRPERVIIEWNGMWKVSDFESMTLPKGWTMEQKLTTVDASTFQMYLNNLKPLFVEMVRGSELVLFNRCTDRDVLPGYRRSVKVVSPQAEVVFEDGEGEINIFDGALPYDLDADVIEILPEDYGIWYIDAMENPDSYVGKTIEVNLKVMRPKAFPSQFFLPGRMAMTCCADDMSFLGYACALAPGMDVKAGDWIKLRAKIGYGKLPMYKGEGPILQAISVEPGVAIDQVVSFN